MEATSTQQLWVIPGSTEFSDFCIKHKIKHSFGNLIDGSFTDIFYYPIDYDNLNVFQASVCKPSFEYIVITFDQFIKLYEKMNMIPKYYDPVWVIRGGKELNRWCSEHDVFFVGGDKLSGHAEGSYYYPTDYENPDIFDCSSKEILLTKNKIELSITTFAKMMDEYFEKKKSLGILYSSNWAVRGEYGINEIFKKYNIAEIWKGNCIYMFYPQNYSKLFDSYNVGVIFKFNNKKIISLEEFERILCEFSKNTVTRGRTLSKDLLNELVQRPNSKIVSVDYPNLLLSNGTTMSLEDCKDSKKIITDVKNEQFKNNNLLSTTFNY